MKTRRLRIENLAARITLDGAGVYGPPEPQWQPVIVALNDDVTNPAAAARGLLKAHGGQLGYVYEHAVKGFSASLPEWAVKALSFSPQVKRVEPDLVMQAFGSGFVPTGVDRIDADQNSVANIDGLRSNIDVGIAIIDTGIDRDHLDLNVVGGRRFETITTGRHRGKVAEDDQFDDDNGHGSHVAGTAAALDDGIGAVGVAPGARLYAVKVLNASGSGYLSGIIAGINWVKANSDVIQVANMSLGGEGVSQTYHEAIQNAVNAGVVFVAAAGNSYRDILGSDHQFGTLDDTIPAAYPEVATISAMADVDGKPGGLGGFTKTGNYADDTFADFSNFSNDAGSPGYDSWYHTNNKVTSPGLGIDLMMPGVDIYSTYKDGGYAIISGTSMASPHAAGLAALYIAKNGRANNASEVYAIRQALIDGGKAWTSDQGLQVPAGDYNPDTPDNYVENIGWAADASLVPTPGIAISPVSGLRTSENGDSASFTVVLNTQPTADVTIEVSSSDPSEGTVTAGATLVFTPLNWNIAQTVTVTGQNDSELDGDVAYMITTSAASSPDTDYHGLDPSDVSVTNLDNELPPAQPLYVAAINFEGKRGDKDWRAVFQIRADSNGNGAADPSDHMAAGVSIGVVFGNLTFTGTTDSTGTFRTDWMRNVGTGNYTAEATDLALTGYIWNPLTLDLEDDSNGNGLPDDVLVR